MSVLFDYYIIIITLKIFISKKILNEIFSILILTSKSLEQNPIFLFPDLTKGLH